MNNYVRVFDLIDFYESEIVRIKNVCAKSREKFDKHKAEYESKFLPKLFGWKYTDDFYSYDFNYEQYWLDIINNKLNRVIYHQKCGLVHIEIDDESHRIDSFYEWCKNNERPY